MHIFYQWDREEKNVETNFYPLWFSFNAILSTLLMYIFSFSTSYFHFLLFFFFLHQFSYLFHFNPLLYAYQNTKLSYSADKEENTSRFSFVFFSSLFCFWLFTTDTDRIPNSLIQWARTVSFDSKYWGTALDVGSSDWSVRKVFCKLFILTFNDDWNRSKEVSGCNEM